MAARHLLSAVRRLWRRRQLYCSWSAAAGPRNRSPKRALPTQRPPSWCGRRWKTKLPATTKIATPSCRRPSNDSPNDAAANWQLGKVRVQGKWQSPAEVERAVKEDGRLVEYQRRRDAAQWTAAEQTDLARWCKKNHLDDQQRLHWQFVVQLQPDNAEAIAALKRLPPLCVLPRPAQVQQVVLSAREAKKAVDRWTPPVVKWRDAAQRGDAALPAAVREKLVKSSDAVEFLSLERALWQQVGLKRKQKAYHFMLLAMVPALGENPHPAAAASLARHAVFAPFDDVRLAAAAELKRRPLDQYAPLLLSGLQMPIEADAQHILLPNGDLTSHYSVFQEGALANQSLGQTVWTGVSVTPGTGTVQFASPQIERNVRTQNPGEVAAAEGQAAADAAAARAGGGDRGGEHAKGRPG